MNVGPYRLLAQLGAGSDGVAYRAEETATGRAVEIRVLEKACASGSRWPGLLKQLCRAALLAHPAVQHLLELHLDPPSPYVVLEGVEAQPLGDLLPLPENQALPLALQVSAALAEAHRLGLAHGRLGPAAIPCTEALRPKLDFSGTEV